MPGYEDKYIMVIIVAIVLIVVILFLPLLLLLCDIPERSFITFMVKLAQSYLLVYFIHDQYHINLSRNEGRIFNKKNSNYIQPWIRTQYAGTLTGY